MIILIWGYWRIYKAKQKVWLADSFLRHIAKNDISIFSLTTLPNYILLIAFFASQTKSIYYSERLVLCAL